MIFSEVIRRLNLKALELKEVQLTVPFVPVSGRPK